MRTTENGSYPTDRFLPEGSAAHMNPHPESAPAVARDSVVPLTVAVTAAAIVAVVGGALLLGGLLTQPPTAAASENPAPRSVTDPAVDLKLTDFQLPTL